MSASFIEARVSAPESAPACIGPNAVIQLAAALDAAAIDSQPIFAAAGVADWLDHLPEHMTDEIPVARLHQQLRRSLPPAQSVAVLQDAGRRTADYLLANRIPKPVQAVLKRLPARLAAWVLVKAIGANAWTFAGSGRFTARAGDPTVFEIADNPLCRGEHAAEPVCAWHAAVFERLFQALVSPHSRAIETSCGATGAATCRFEVRLRP